MSERPSRAHGKPVYIESANTDESASPLTKVEIAESGTYDENWLQNLLFRNPSMLPINEIEPAYSSPVPICRELPLRSGYLDLIYANEYGLLTLVECKLWRNPQARREVVGQLLDYAKEISQMSYGDLQAAIGKASDCHSGNPLFETVSEAIEEISEADFVDNVCRNLRTSRFLLLIAGDGIRESTEDIIDFMQQHSGMRFAMALVEFPIFEMPESVGHGLIVEPRVVTRTREIERAVVRIDGTGIAIEQPETQKTARSTSTQEPVRISEEIYMEALAKVDSDLPNLARDMFERWGEMGGIVSLKKASMILHWPHESLGHINFGTLLKDGTVRTNYICGSAEDAGDVSIGERYLARVAEILGGGVVVKKGKPWTWHVKKNGQQPSAKDLLEKRSEWLDAITETLQEFHDLAAKEP